MHALKHFGSRSDASGVPSQHAPLCLECASLAPLAGAHGGHANALTVDFLAGGLAIERAGLAIVAARDTRPFQARAPPR